jgi:hypothetical protein
MDRRAFLLSPLALPVVASASPEKTQHLRTLNTLTWNAIEFLLSTEKAAAGHWWHIAIRRMSCDFEQDDWVVPTPKNEWVLFAPNAAFGRHTWTTRTGDITRYQIDETFDCTLPAGSRSPYVFLIATDGTRQICIRAIPGQTPVVTSELYARS